MGRIVFLKFTRRGSQLGSFYDHSLRVVRFLPVPTEVGGKYRNAVMSVGQDHSISLISLEDFSRQRLSNVAVLLLDMVKKSWPYIGEQMTII